MRRGSITRHNKQATRKIVKKKWMTMIGMDKESEEEEGENEARERMEQC